MSQVRENGVQVLMFDRFMTAEGFTYIALKALRDFVMVYAATIGASAFVATPDSMKVAAISAAGTAGYRLVRELFLRFMPEEPIG